MDNKTLVIVAATALLVVAAAAKAAVDILTHQAGNNIFEKLGGWWDARNSWKRKYKDYDGGDLDPAFPGAKTWLVALTDFWHTADSVYLTGYLLSANLCGMVMRDLPWWGMILFVAGQKAAFGFVFEICYKFKFRLKRES